jgi:hypothetical protein
MGKYDPLAKFLFPLPKREIRLTFAQIEETLGSALPPTARKDRPWWANTLASNHGAQWLLAGWKVAHVDLDGESVRFVRDDTKQKALQSQSNGKRAVDPTLIRSSRRYSLLRDYLGEIPSEQIQVALTFEEIGQVLGGKLPATAFHDRPWWANTKRSPQGNAWVSAGWRLSAVHLKAQVAVFRRRHEDPLRIIPRFVSDLLDGKTHSTNPGASRIVEWIGFCRRVGWYFEGTVLYERVGLNGATLTEAQEARVEEDYAVCRRELARFRRNRESAGAFARSEEELNGQE